MNSVILTGNTTSDIELKATKSGTSFCKFNLAVKRDKENTDFIPCEAWKVTAEVISKYVKKGDKIGIRGSLQGYKFEKEGKTLTSWSVVVNEFDFMQKRQEATQKPQKATEPVEDPPVDFYYEEPEDLPF